MILVDSSVWIDFFNGTTTSQTEKLEEILGFEQIAVGDLIIVEVLQGFRYDNHFNKANELLSSLVYFSLSNEFLAVRAAQNYRYLKKKGITVRKTIDTIIATFCIHQNMALLHDDNDFRPFARHLGLRII